ncbi:MAG: DNA repair protein RecO [Pseudomonadales bacterium]|jgi:DNA repair protein RecO (recombination protein O)|nr:DNA repair protein RecO [Pseudomonadales bacterium]
MSTFDNSNRGVLEPAYILHSRDYRDTSLIIDVLTRDFGRYSLVVRGARSSKSKIRGRLQPFTPLLVGSTGRGELKTATTIDFPGAAWRLQGQNLMLGLYVNELLYRLLGKFDPVPEIYESYEDLLQALQSAAGGVLSIRLFELTLLEALGYGISFEYDAGNGERVTERFRYRFIVQEGFRKTAADDHETFTGAELLSIAARELEHVSDAKLKQVTRSSLGVLLGEKPLKSRSLFRSSS